MKDENYDWLTLDEGEKIEWSGSPRIKSIISAVVVGIPMMLFFGIGLLIIAGAYLSVKNTDYVVTNDGLYVKKGVLSRSVQKVGFNKVQNISFSQGVLGNYFGYGNIEISTAGGQGVEMKFRSINNPKEVQEKINGLMKGHQRSSGGSGEIEASEKKILKEILKEVRAMRKEIENV